jgi:uncharacterized PurR-regulated membrane protein YhhQ (DUF165 family)
MTTARQILPPALAMSAIVLVSNLLVQFPINPWLTWGAFSYPVAYFVTDVCNRTSGPSVARRVAWVGFAVGLILSAIFAPLRIALASGTAFIVSQLLDVSIFKKPGGKLRSSVPRPLPSWIPPFSSASLLPVRPSPGSRSPPAILA